MENSYSLQKDTILHLCKKQEHVFNKKKIVQSERVCPVDAYVCSHARTPENKLTSGTQRQIP